MLAWNITGCLKDNLQAAFQACLWLAYDGGLAAQPHQDQPRDQAAHQDNQQRDGNQTAKAIESLWFLGEAFQKWPHGVLPFFWLVSIVACAGVRLWNALGRAALCQPLAPASDGARQRRCFCRVEPAQIIDKLLLWRGCRVPLGRTARLSQAINLLVYLCWRKGRLIWHHDACSSLWFGIKAAQLIHSARKQLADGIFVLAQQARNLRTAQAADEAQIDHLLLQRR